MALSSTALLTLAEVQEHLEIYDSAQLGYLEILTERVTAWIEKKTGRRLKSRTYTNEITSGWGKSHLMMYEWPVMAVSGVDFILNVAPTSWESQSLTELLIDSYDLRTVRFRDRVFPKGTDNVRLTYTAGYVTVPEDLKQLALELVTQKHRIKDRQMAGVTAATFQGQTVSYFTGNMLRETEFIFDAYRRLEY